VNADAPRTEADVAGQRVLEIQTKLHRWATDEPQRRFDDLYNLVYDPAFLVTAWGRVKGNRGSRSAGVDGQTARYISAVRGEGTFLAELRADLKARRFRPLPVRERMIPKPNGKQRRLGIATVRDRVVQAALKLVLEPIFEADFEPCSYGFRPGRRTQDAIAEIHFFCSRSYEWVLEGDITACFDEIDHTALMGRVHDRIGDQRVLGLVRAFLKAGILGEDGVERDTDTGTPQGGILSPLLSNVALSVLDEHFAAAWRTTANTLTARRRLWRQGLATYRLIRYADDCVPRTLKEVLDVEGRIHRKRCCTGDGGRPSAAALQGEAANHRKLLQSRAGVVSVADKAHHQCVRCEPGRRTRVNH
jgi:RNA-directed DNA polymerase